MLGKMFDRKTFVQKKKCWSDIGSNIVEPTNIVQRLGGALKKNVLARA